MYDELTEVDIKKMQEEIDHRIRVLRPQLIEAVQTARAFGDLSANYAGADDPHRQGHPGEAPGGCRGPV